MHHWSFAGLATGVVLGIRAAIFDLRQIQAGSQDVTEATTPQRLIAETGEDLLVCEDLSAPFCLFKLPEAWAEYLVLERAVRESDVGLPGSEKRYVGLTVLPMAWSSYLALLRAAHSGVALYGHHPLVV